MDWTMEIAAKPDLEQPGPLRFRAVRENGNELIDWIIGDPTVTPPSLITGQPLLVEGMGFVYGRYEYQQRVGDAWVTLIRCDVED